jgi:hypothetical protein
LVKGAHLDASVVCPVTASFFVFISLASFFVPAFKSSSVVFFQVCMRILQMFVDIRLCFMGKLWPLAGFLRVIIPFPIRRIQDLGLLYRQRIHQSLIR